MELDVQPHAPATLLVRKNSGTDWIANCVGLRTDMVPVEKRKNCFALAVIRTPSRPVCTHRRHPNDAISSLRPCRLIYLASCGKFRLLLSETCGRIVWYKFQKFGETHCFFSRGLKATRRRLFLLKSWHLHTRMDAITDIVNIVNFQWIVNGKGDCRTCPLCVVFNALLCFGARCWWRSWLRHCAASQKVPGSTPDGVIILPAALCLCRWLSLQQKWMET